MIGLALGGKGFAYVPFGPVFITDVVLLLGLLLLMLDPKRAGATMRNWLAWPLLVYIAFGCAHVAAGVSDYGMNAFHDGALIGYAVFGLIVSSYATSDAHLPDSLVSAYRRFSSWFLILAGPIFFGFLLYGDRLPVWPGTVVPYCTRRLVTCWFTSGQSGQRSFLVSYPFDGTQRCCGVAQASHS